MDRLMLSALLVLATFGFAHAQNFPEILSKAMSQAGCVMSEANMVTVLKRKGADTWTTNIVITNMSKSKKLKYDAGSGNYRLKRYGKCK